MNKDQDRRDSPHVSITQARVNFDYINSLVTPRKKRSKVINDIINEHRVRAKGF